MKQIVCVIAIMGLMVFSVGAMYAQAAQGLAPNRTENANSAPPEIPAAAPLETPATEAPAADTPAVDTPTPDAPEVDTRTAFQKMPKNVITVDIGPTLVGLSIGGFGQIMSAMGVEALSSSGFGIAAQYERQLHEKFSVGGRFAYLGSDFGIVEEEYGARAELGMKITSFSIEAHARYYPIDVFFLDAMLGYGYLLMAFSGEAWVDNEELNSLTSSQDLTSSQNKIKEKVSFDAQRNYFKLGIKLGLLIDPGKPGGFVFEPSAGFYGGIGLGKTLGEQLMPGVDQEGIDILFGVFENTTFIGGPRLSIAFGWRF